jgi:hypothetical protein
VILREDALVPALDGWLSGVFAPHRRQANIAELITAWEADEPPQPDDTIQRQVRDLDAKLARYRDALDAGADQPSSPDGSGTYKHNAPGSPNNHPRPHPPAQTG